MESKVLVIVDMQNDFIDGSLSNKEAQKIVPRIVNKINIGDYTHIILTRDTHDEKYLESFEGKKLPIEHCIEGTTGWCVNDEIRKAVVNKGVAWEYLNKKTFGEVDYYKWDNVLPKFLDMSRIDIVGTCTDICVISNALILRGIFPDIKIVVDAFCCAGTTTDRHYDAIEVMKSCQIDVIG